MEDRVDIINQLDKMQSSDTFSLPSTSDDRNNLSPVFHDETQKSDNYYEVVSADGSIGGDDDDVSDIDSELTGYLSQNNAHFENVSVKQNKNELSSFESFLDLPFVPKIEFTEKSSPSVPALKNSYIDSYEIKKGIPKVVPNFDFSIPPPNYKAINNVDQNSNSSGVQHIGHLFPPFNFNIEVNNRTNNLNSLSNGGLLLNDDTFGNDTVLPLVLDNTMNMPSPPKVPIADWLDENGDPVKGAFDNIEVKNSSKNITSKNSKVEYVFSVRETKNVPVSDFFVSRDVTKINSLTNTNVLPDIVAGNLGLSAESLKVYEEEKKLFLASKTGEEYKASLQASSSVEPVVSKIVAENAKRELLNKFRKNTVNDKKISTIEEFPKEEHKKTLEEVALESQAVTEILKDIQRGAARAKEQGALGWQKCPVPVTNKTFLRNTLVSTLREPYRPPSKRGRFHVGLKRDKLQSNCGDNDRSESDSRSSRSRKSHSPSRGHSFSTQSNDGDIKERSYHRRDRGSWDRGSEEFYDTWAAYYGYQWYGPEAYSMYYNSERWPNDSYMYYGDPQAWQNYISYFGPRSTNYHEQSIRSRRRGRRKDSCARDLRDYLGYPRSRSHSYSRSSSLNRSESCDSGGDRSTFKRHRDNSHSDNRSKSRDNSHSDNRSKSRSHKRRKDCNISATNVHNYSSSPEHNDSDLKKKLKKKKKKHKKKSKKHKNTLVKDTIESKDHVEDTNTSISETIPTKRNSQSTEKQVICKSKQNNTKHKSISKNKDIDSEVKRKNKHKTIISCEKLLEHCDMTADNRHRSKDLDKRTKDYTEANKGIKLNNQKQSLQKIVQHNTRSQTNSDYGADQVQNEDSKSNAKKYTRKL